MGCKGECCSSSIRSSVVNRSTRENSEGSVNRDDNGFGGVGSVNRVARSIVIRDMRVGRVIAGGEDDKGTLTLLVIREARDEDSSIATAEGVVLDGAGNVAATGQGSKALGVGPEGGA